MIRRLIAGSILLLALGCKGEEPAPPDVTGTWAGTTGTLHFRLVLSQSGATVTGNGTVAGTTDGIPLTITGTFAPPEISMLMIADGYEPMNYSGTQTDADAIIGTLTGSGFNGDGLSLRRQ